MKNYFLLFISIVSMLHLSAQDIEGCTDPQANNYNPAATINDGSCTYNPSIYKPGFRFLLPNEVDETSGLIFYADGFWTHNDSGGEATIYKLDTVTGQVIQRITLAGINNRDWEDLAQDEEYIYVGDFGNNAGNTANLAIYILEKSAIPSSGDATISAEKIQYSYPDFPGKIDKRRDNNFDCEAMIATETSLYLFSKNRGDNKSKLYQLPKVAGNYIADLLMTFNSSGLVTGADLNPNNNELILVGYTNNDWIPFLWVMFDFEDEDFFSGNKRRIDMLNMTATQTEAICYTHGKTGILTSESNPLFVQSLFDFSTSKWTDSETSSIPEDQSTTFDFSISPNPIHKQKLKLIFGRLPEDYYQIVIYDSMGRMIQTEDYKVKRHENGSKMTIKIPGLKSGVYFVRVIGVKEMLEKKFIINS